MTDPILITGCARSGTSMVAGIINLCGAFGGEMSGPTVNNRKGMFENSHVRNKIVKPYFRKLGVDPLGQYPLPNVDELYYPADWGKKIRDTMIHQGYNSGPWMYKGAKMCLHWPVWDVAFPHAKWIIVRRRTGDIVNSCIKTGFMRAFQQKINQQKVNVNNEREGWIWWVHQHHERFKEMMDAGLDVRVIWPERFVDGDFKQIKDTIEWLGLRWNHQAYDFIDKKLWKTRLKK